MKKIRLNKDAYLQTGYPCHITICSLNGNPIFESKEFTFHCLELLESLCDKFEIQLYVYCFMPEHIHIILTVEGQKSIIELVQDFKGKSTIESYNFDYKGKIYQTRFFDHFIRTDQSLENEIRYVLENPVRRGLVENYRDYPFCKCFIESWDFLL
jgi:putative transposase